VAAAELDKVFAQMQDSKILKAFNTSYPQHRAKAAAEGYGFMPYCTALARLKSALAQG